MSSPTTGQQICDQYDLQASDFDGMPPNIRALFRAAYAADVLHVQEEPEIGTPGNPVGSANTGPDVNRYLGICGFPDGGEPWCAAFGTAMLVDSGVGLDQLPDGPAATHNWINWAVANGNTLDGPTRGCAGIIVESPTSGHFVFCSDDLGNGNFATIEGNTNPDGSSEGYGVFRRHRANSQIHTWVDLSGLTS